MVFSAMSWWLNSNGWFGLRRNPGRPVTGSRSIRPLTCCPGLSSFCPLCSLHNGTRLTPVVGPPCLYACMWWIWHFAAGMSQPGQVHARVSNTAASRCGWEANRLSTFTNAPISGMTGDSSDVPVTAAQPVEASFSLTTSRILTSAPSVVVIFPSLWKWWFVAIMNIGPNIAASRSALALLRSFWVKALA